MAKMAPLGVDPTKEENALEAEPVQHHSHMQIHTGDAEKMGMNPVGQGDHVEGTVHGIVTHTHEGGIGLKLTHGGLKKVGKSAAQKLYGDGEAGGEGGTY